MYNKSNTFVQIDYKRLVLVEEAMHRSVEKNEKKTIGKKKSERWASYAAA